MAKRSYSFKVDPEEYPELVRWLDGQDDNRSGAIRDVLQAHVERRITLGDVYQAVRDLERKVEAGATVSKAPADDETDWNEPPEAAAALDALANL